MGWIAAVLASNFTQRSPDPVREYAATASAKEIVAKNTGAAIHVIHDQADLEISLTWSCQSCADATGFGDHIKC